MSFATQLAEHFVARQSILERYIDVCPIPCFIVNKEGETIFINEAYQQAFDARLDQVNEGQWERLVHPEDLETYKALWVNLLRRDRTAATITIRTIVGNEPITSVFRITHVPGNGFIGYILFQCSSSDNCPVRHVIENYLSKLP